MRKKKTGFLSSLFGFGKKKSSKKKVAKKELQSKPTKKAKNKMVKSKKNKVKKEGIKKTIRKYSHQKKANEKNHLQHVNESDIFYEKKERHFRGRKTKVKGETRIHPNYIIGEDEENYVSLGLTHSPKKGKKHKNHEMNENPKKDDNSKIYMRKKIEAGNKNEYSSNKWENYQISDVDDEYVDTLIDKVRNNNK